MPTYVAIDDKITRVHPDYTVCETVESVTREGFSTKSAPGLTSLRHSGEGITWVRGWHTPDSEEVKAAQVAQGLEENKEQVAPGKSLEELVREAILRQQMTLPPPPPPPQPAPYPGGNFGSPYGIGGVPVGTVGIVTLTTTAPAPIPFPGSIVKC